METNFTTSFTRRILAKGQEAIIANAATLPSYTASPVSPEIRAEFQPIIAAFVHIPLQVRTRLCALFPAGTDVDALLQEIWEADLAFGAIRMHAADKVNFALPLSRENGEVLEASFSRTRNADTVANAKPWYMNYVPSPQLLGAAAPESSATATAMATLRYTSDYQNAPLSEFYTRQLSAYDQPFSQFVHLGQKNRQMIAGAAPIGTDVDELLDRDWATAFSARTVREYEGKVIFPISVMRADGTTPIEVSIKPSTYNGPAGAEGIKPWCVCYVNDYCKPKPKASRALDSWALVSWQDMLEDLAALALPELWDFESTAQGSTPRYFILRNYLAYTFYRLQQEDKVAENPDMGLAAFNTGLVTATYEPIFACFQPTEGEQAWRFAGFCRAGERGLGKDLVRAFDPLPARAGYFTRKEDLLYDASRKPQLDYDHIMIDNIDRLPLAFLRNELHYSVDAMELLDDLEAETDVTAREELYDELRDLIEGDARMRNRLNNRLDDAVDLALKRTDWNYKTAIPAFYPERDIMSLLLPLDITEDDHSDIALVVELTESGAYLGQTILTMRMAYLNARLVCRPDSDWLSAEICGPSDDEEQ